MTNALQHHALIAAKSYVETLINIRSMVVENDDEMVEVADMLKQTKHKWKVLEDERKISVTPMNERVKEINGWFKPGIDALGQLEDALKRLLADYELRKRKEQDRILKEASDVARLAAQKALAAPSAVIDAVGAAQAQADSAAASLEVLKLAQAATKSVAAKAVGISTREVTKWEVFDEKLLPRECLSPDAKKISFMIDAGCTPEEAAKKGIRMWQDMIVSARA